MLKFFKEAKQMKRIKVVIDELRSSECSNETRQEAADLLVESMFKEESSKRDFYSLILGMGFLAIIGTALVYVIT